MQKDQSARPPSEAKSISEIAADIGAHADDPAAMTAALRALQKKAEAEQRTRPNKTPPASPPSRSSRPTPPVARSIPLQLPFWPEARRGIPSQIVRSALFTVTKGKARRHFDGKTVIASLSNIEIRFTGDELRQREEDVYLQLLHMARRRNLGEYVEFTAVDLIRELGWTVSGRSYRELDEILRRLNLGTVSIVGHESRGRWEHSGSLISTFLRFSADGHENSVWRVVFDRELAVLFHQNRYTLINWEQRLKLTPLAKWLHSFYHSHREPYPYLADTLHQMCGSTMRNKSKFRADLRRALEELKTAGFLVDWQMDAAGKVSVQRRTDEPDDETEDQVLLRLAPAAP